MQNSRGQNIAQISGNLTEGSNSGIVTSHTLLFDFFACFCRLKNCRENEATEIHDEIRKSYSTGMSLDLRRGLCANYRGDTLPITFRELLKAFQEQKMLRICPALLVWYWKVRLEFQGNTKKKSLPIPFAPSHSGRRTRGVLVL
jgi:hypothetical protein